MANFANIQLHTGFVVDPFLSELVDKIALRNPTYTIGTKGIDEQMRERLSSVRPRGRGNFNERVDGLRYIYKLNVHCGSELLGSISVDVRYVRTSGSELVYCINSWRINNERGSQNVTKTAKLDVAVRTAKRVFVPQNMNELMEQTENTVSNSMRDTLMDLRRPIASGHLVGRTIDLHHYLYLHLNNMEIPPELKRDVEPTFTSAKYHNAMSEYRLANHMANMPYRYYRAHNGGYIHWRQDTQDSGTAVSQDNRTAVFSAFEELSEQTQNHISVLQLMQDNELVLDVGYRYNGDCFAVVDHT